MKKILLLTDIPPCDNLTAGIFLNHLCKNIPDERLAIFTVLNPYLKPNLYNRYQNIPIKYAEKPFEGWGHRKNGRLSSFYHETIYAINDLPKISSQIVRFSKEQNVEAIWVIIQGQMMIRLASIVMNKLDLPIYPQVMDPPDWWFRDWKVNSIHTKIFLHRFDQLMRRAEKIGVASWAMEKAYSQKYNVEAVPLVSPIDESVVISPSHEKNEAADKNLIIGMAGQLYAATEWNALINALDSANWNIGSRKVKIKLLGDHSNTPNVNYDNVEVLGWKSQKEVIQILSQCDISYLPYWFDPNYEQEARLCFPSKLTSYLAAGLPVFVHSPRYASPAEFVSNHNAGIVCDSLEHNVIISTLTSLVETEKEYQQFAENGNKALNTYLTHEAVGKQVERFLPL